MRKAQAAICWLQAPRTSAAFVTHSNPAVHAPLPSLPARPPPQALLQLLHDGARFATPGSGVHAALEQVTSQLAPLLATPLPPTSGAAPVLMGPLAKLPQPVQLQGLDLLASLPAYPPSLLKAVVVAAQCSTYPDAALLRLLEGLLHRAASVLPPDVLLSLVASLLAPPAAAYVSRGGGGRGGSGVDEALTLTGGLDRHLMVVKAVVRWLPGYGSPVQLLAMLEPCLLQRWQQLGSGPDDADAARRLASSLVLLATAAAAAREQQQRAPGAVVAAALWAQLPDIAARLCFSWSGGGSPASGAPATAAAAAAAAAALPSAAAEPWALVLALLEAAHELALPTLEALAAGPGGSDGPQWVRERLPAVQLVMAHKPLAQIWLQHEAALWALHERLSGWAQGQQESTGDELCVADCQRLKAALQNLFARG